MNQFKEEYELAKSIALEVGDMLNNQKHKEILSQEDRDIKLKLDQEAESAILKQIREVSEYSIHSEESGLSGGLKEDEPYWIVDPIDGTMNYSRDFPMACVSIAFWKNRKPIFGIVYDFYRNELFEGVVGLGAYINGEPIHPKGVSDSTKSILATGIPTYLKTDRHAKEIFTQQIFKYKKVRMIGSAALSLCYVACGRVDAYIERSIKIWDIAAGIAICESVQVNSQLEFLEHDLLNVSSNVNEVNDEN